MNQRPLEKASYYNAEIYNNTFFPIDATLDDSRNVPLLLIPNGYCVAFDRFDIPGCLIPFFEWIDGAFILTISFTDLGVETEYSEPLIFLPYDEVTYGSSNKYVFNISQVMRSFNAAATAIMNTINITHGTSYTTPFINYKAGEGFSLYFGALDDWFPDVTVQPYLKMYMNTPLNNLFLSFDGERISYNSIDGKDFMIHPYNDFNNNEVIYSATTYIKLTQEADSIYAWNDFVKILFESNLPIKSEVIKAVNGNPNFNNILADFVPTFNGDFRNNDYYQYFPQGPLRWIEFINPTPLYTIRISVKLQKKDGTKITVKIPPNQFVSMKLIMAPKEQVLFV
jgi:hypothetical protein